MSRRQAREAALQTLFQMELNPPPLSETEAAWQTLALDAVAAEMPLKTKKDYGYAAALVRGTRDHIADIDAAIAASSYDWSLARMACVDRNIVRIAVYEMKYGKEKIDVGIAINEAVELAKKFGTDDSGRYVNGILGGLSG